MLKMCIFGAMKRIHPLKIHIFFMVLALLAVSCGRSSDDPYKVLNVRIFTVSGTVFGVTGEGDHAPLSGITVTMSAYAVEDIGKTIPVYTDSFTTLDNGTYQFFKIWDEDCSGLFFDFLLTDRSSERTVRFAPSSRDLFLSAASPFYNPDIKTYEVTGNDFLLYPAED